MATTTEQPTISEVLEAARVERGISQRKTAVELDTTPGTYRQWLRGQVPGLDRLEAFMEFTGHPKVDILLAIAEAEDRLGKGAYVSSLLDLAVAS